LRLLNGDVDRVAGGIQDANAVFGGPSDLVLTLRFVGGAVGTYAASYPELAVPEEANELRLYGTEAVMAVGRDDIRIHRPDGTVETYRVEGTDGGYYNEFLDFHGGVVDGAPVVGTVAQSWRNLQLVVGGIEAARRERTVAIDPWPNQLSASAVPLWRPAGAKGLFDGLPSTLQREVGREH
jgi:hypothetical protein